MMGILMIICSGNDGWIITRGHAKLLLHNVMFLCFGRFMLCLSIITVILKTLHFSFIYVWLTSWLSQGLRNNVYQISCMGAHKCGEMPQK